MAMGTKDSCNLHQRSFPYHLLLAFASDACRWDRMVAMGNVVLLDNLGKMALSDLIAAQQMFLLGLVKVLQIGMNLGVVGDPGLRVEKQSKGLECLGTRNP